MYGLRRGRGGARKRNELGRLGWRWRLLLWKFQFGEREFGVKELTNLQSVINYSFGLTALGVFETKTEIDSSAGGSPIKRYFKNYISVSACYTGGIVEGV